MTDEKITFSQTGKSASDSRDAVGLYLGYSWDSGFIRNGKPGSGLIPAWYKTF
jgi:uncharacterized protein with beta-barrel porin domain